MVSIPLEMIVKGGDSTLNFVKRLGDESKASLFSWERMSKTVGEVTNLLGAATLGMFTTLAGVLALSPSLADIWEGMKFQFWKISETVAQAFRPAMEKALEIVTGIADWITAHPDLLKALSDSFVNLADGAQKAWNIVSNFVKEIEIKFDIDIGAGVKWLIDTFGAGIVSAIIGGGIGFRAGGPMGAVWGAGIGFTAGQTLGNIGKYGVQQGLETTGEQLQWLNPAVRSNPALLLPKLISVIVQSPEGDTMQNYTQYGSG